jgi:hypothetical protein
VQYAKRRGKKQEGGGLHPYPKLALVPILGKRLHAQRAVPVRSWFSRGSILFGLCHQTLKLLLSGISLGVEFR